MKVNRKEVVPVIIVADKWGLSAVFPTLPGSSYSDFTTYASGEGHSSGTKGWYRTTKVVKDKDILNPLLEELKRIYDDVNLKLVYKFIPSYDRIRLDEYKHSKKQRESLSDEVTSEVKTETIEVPKTEKENIVETETIDLPEINSENTRDSQQIATVSEMKYSKFPALKIPTKYRNLIGKVPVNFRMLLWGAPGHGKSSLALMLANDIAKNTKVLFVSAEESLQSATLANRIKRFKTNSKNLIFNDSNNTETIERIINTYNPKFVVIDSVNVIKGKVEAVLALMQKFPEVGFIVIAQATKDHKRYSGISSLAHAVDIVINVSGGKAEAEKNRYSALGSMTIQGIFV